MENQDFCLDLEYAVLEQSINKVSELFENIKTEDYSQEYIKLISELRELVSSFCCGEYVDALKTTAATTFFGTTTTEEIDVYLRNRSEQYLASKDQNILSLKQLVVLFIGAANLQLFVQQNWTGPPIDVKVIEFLPASLEAQRQDGSLQDNCIRSLSDGGECIYSMVQSAVHLLVANVLLVEGMNRLTLVKSACIWALRCLNMKQTVIEEHSNAMMYKCFELIKKVETSPFCSVERNRNISCQIHMEIGHLYIHYYETTKAKEHFTTAQSLLGITLNLTGALGKRTKFQKDFLSQLKLDVKHDDTLGSITEVCQAFANIDVSGLPKNVYLDDDVVLDRINFKEDENKNDEPCLNPLEKVVILSICILSEKSQAIHVLTTEELVTYIESVVRQPLLWSVQSMALNMRSKLEKGSSRKMERSMMQLQVLVDAVNLKEPKVHVRQMLFYCLPLQPTWTVQHRLAQVLMAMGAVKSACDIYQSLHMWENVIACYQLLGRNEKAENLVREQLKVKETPTLWCLLGDITKDAFFYEKAWEVSNHHSARAQRSLGLLHLRAARYAECIPFFQASLNINGLQANIWFSLGCAAMATKVSELARTAFHRCLSIDTDNAEAWNNLANVYIQLNDRKKAHAVLKESLRANYENWFIWENFLLISTQVGAYNDSINAFHRLMDLRDKYKDVEILGIVVKAVCEGIDDTSGNSAVKLRKELLKLMGRITSQITNDSEIWFLYSKLYLMMDDSAEDREKGLHFLVKAHRLKIQSPNWETDIKQFQEAIDMTLHLAEVYMKVSENKTNSTEAIQVLSSAKLVLKQLITKATNHHKDTMTGEIHKQLAEGVGNLEAKLTLIMDAIIALKSQ